MCCISALPSFHGAPLEKHMHSWDMNCCKEQHLFQLCNLYLHLSYPTKVASSASECYVTMATLKNHSGSKTLLSWLMVTAISLNVLVAMVISLREQKKCLRYIQ